MHIYSTYLSITATFYVLVPGALGQHHERSVPSNLCDKGILNAGPVTLPASSKDKLTQVYSHMGAPSDKMLVVRPAAEGGDAKEDEVFNELLGDTYSKDDVTRELAVVGCSTGNRESVLEVGVEPKNSMEEALVVCCRKRV